MYIGDANNGGDNEDDRPTVKRPNISEQHRSSSNFSLELAGRNTDSTEHGNKILTISMDDDQNLEILPDNFQTKRVFPLCKQNLKHRIEIVLLIVTFLWLFVSILLVEVLKQKSLTNSARTFLMFMRSVGIFTFFGQLSLYLAMKIMFSSTHISCWERSSYIEAHKITQILKCFLLSVVFEEAMMSDYLQRVNALQEQTFNTNLLEVMDTTQIDSFVSDKIEKLFFTAEGAILGMIGVDKSELLNISKLFVIEIICDLQSLIQNDKPAHMLTPEAIRRHAEMIANQQLNGLSINEVNKFLEKLMAQKHSKMALIHFALMALIGCIVHVVYTYGLLKT